MSGFFDDPFGTLINAGQDVLGTFIGSDKKIDIPKALGVLTTIGGATGLFDSDQKQVGYQGKIPEYDATRTQVPYDYVDEMETRRPGSLGRRYFSDTMFTAPSDTPQAQQVAQQQAQELFDNRTVAPMAAPTTQALDRPRQNYQPPAQQEFTGSTFDDFLQAIMDQAASGDSSNQPTQPGGPGPATQHPDLGGLSLGGLGANGPPAGWGLKSPKYNPTTGKYEAQGYTWIGQDGQKQPNQADLDALLQWQRRFDPSKSEASWSEWAGRPTGYAQGGIATLQGGGYMQGRTDGMADEVPASIDDVQEARMAHGEFVLPADVVSHLGNGNSEAGAQQLYDMMDRIRAARTGNPKQGREIDPDQFVPV